MLKKHEIKSAAEISEALAPIRGHNMAKAAIESAAWDAEAKSQNIPLWKHLGGTREEIPCGVSIGIQPNIETLLAKVEKELSAGYQRIKIKIQPGWDLKPVEALRERWPRIRLMVDANSAYTLKDAAHLKQLDRFYLIMIEQPLSWDDIHNHATLQKQLETPICLDESIHSVSRRPSSNQHKRLPHNKYKNGQGRWPHPRKKIHDICQGKRNPSLVRRHARIRHRPRPKYSPIHAPKFRATRRRLRQQTILGRRHNQPRSRSNPARHNKSATSPRHRLRTAKRSNRIPNKKERSPIVMRRSRPASVGPALHAGPLRAAIPTTTNPVRVMNSRHQPPPGSPILA